MNILEKLNYIIRTGKTLDDKHIPLAHMPLYKFYGCKTHEQHIKSIKNDLDYCNKKLNQLKK